MGTVRVLAVFAAFSLLSLYGNSSHASMSSNPQTEALVQCQDKIDVANQLPEIQGSDYAGPEQGPPVAGVINRYTSSTTAADQILNDTNLLARPSQKNYKALLGERDGETGIWFYAKNGKVTFVPLDTTAVPQFGHMSNECDKYFGETNPSLMFGNIEAIARENPQLLTNPQSAAIIHACNALANTDQAFGQNPIFVNGVFNGQEVSVGIKTEGVGGRRNAVMRVNPAFARHPINAGLYRVSNMAGTAGPNEEFFDGVTDLIIHKLDTIDAYRKENGFKSWGTVWHAGLMEAVKFCHDAFKSQPGYEKFAASLLDHGEKLYGQTPVEDGGGGVINPQAGNRIQDN